MKSLPLRVYRAALLALILLFFSRQGVAQDVEPVRPVLSSTSQDNPRGADIVEPAVVEKHSRYADGRSEPTYLGVAKIPDPRKNEVGATVASDIESSVLIRLGGAWIYDQHGFRRTVPFDDSEREELLVFKPGPHDDVVSLQGVRPLVRRVGDVVVFDLRELYEASTLNPLTGGRNGTDDGAPRLAMLRMESTFPGGEAVDLAVVVVPYRKPEPAMRPIVFERRDTTILSAHLSYVVQEEVRVESPWSAALIVETGMGHSRLSTEIPATLHAPFTSKGDAGVFYLDAKLYLRRNNNRWALHTFGTSSITETEFAAIDHHQVSLRADARFEHGTRFYLLTEASGEMIDKQYQEFDWDSADYAGSLGIGAGHRSFDATGYERTRAEILLGLRMGENRRIEILETRDRSRGIGPQADVTLEYAHALGGGFEFRAGTEARGYSIFGRGYRDRGFAEKGLLTQTDFRFGKSFLGVAAYAGVTSFWTVKSARFLEGGRYYENRLLLAPGLALQTYL